MVIKNLLGKKEEKPANDAEVKKLQEKFNNIVNSEEPQSAGQPAPNQVQPATQEFQYVDPQKAEDNERITNLIMQQIKELIEIDNNLNAKNKELENKISENASTLSSTKSLVEQFNSRLELIEKNMEKFMGLYEVVTNRFNPFVSEEDDGGKPVAPSILDKTPEQLNFSKQEEKPAQPQPNMMDLQGDPDISYDTPTVEKEVSEIIEHTKLDNIEPEQQTIIKDELKETVETVGPAEIDKIKDEVATHVTEIVQKEMKNAMAQHMKLSNEQLQNSMKAMLDATVKQIKDAQPTEKSAPQTEELHEDFHFNLPDGTPIKRISDLRDALKTMDDAHFKEHVDESHNDFADWIHVVLKNDEISEKIKSEKTKEGIAKILESIK